MADGVKPIPDGQHAITPYLTAKDAPSAVAFYEKAFGAKEMHRMTCPQTGLIMHSTLKIGDSLVMLSEEFPSMGPKSPWPWAAPR